VPTLNTILKEIKDVPVNRLDELYQVVTSMTPKPAKNSNFIKKKILSYGGSLKDMTQKDFSEFVNHNKETRNNLFDRKIEL